MLLQQSIRLHRWLLWSALIGLIIFVLSALSHPLMVWTGPQSKVFLAPPMVVDGKVLRQFAEQLQQPGVKAASTVKLVATKQGAMVQLSYANNERQYLSLSNIDPGNNALLDNSPIDC